MAGAQRRKKARRAKEASVSPPPGLEGSRLAVEGQELAVLTFPMHPPSLPPNLSAAEREVALAVIDGCSNAQIAADRKTSVRTVANQIVAIYRKLGLHSRPELIVALAGARDDVAEKDRSS